MTWAYTTERQSDLLNITGQVRIESMSRLTQAHVRTVFQRPHVTKLLDRALIFFSRFLTSEPDGYHWADP